MYEKLDIYDENRIKTGKIIERKENIPLEKNELVLAVQCWIINNKNEILLTQRKVEKKYKELIANLDTFLFDIEFCSEDLQYETYTLHPEIYDAQTGLDYVEWWTENNCK